MTNCLLKDSIVGIVRLDRFVFRGLTMRLFPILFSVFFLTALYAPNAQADFCRYNITSYVYNNPELHISQRGWFFEQVVNFSIFCENIAAPLREYLDTIPALAAGEYCVSLEFPAGKVASFEPRFSITNGNCPTSTGTIPSKVDSDVAVIVSGQRDDTKSDKEIAPLLKSRK